MVKEGYKQTEIGVIPEDWKIVSLADVCCKGGIVRGPFGGALKKEIFVSEGYKVYEQGNAIYRSVTRGKYYVKENKYKEMIRFAVNSGDFIVSCSGTIGMIYQIPRNAPKGIINQALLKLSVNKLVVNANYFYLYFSCEEFNKRITDDTQGGAIKNLVSMELFKKTWMLLPELVEQKRIAEALLDVDDMISSLEKLIEKKKAIKQGAMQDLLTGKKRIPGFTDEWRIICLGEISKIKTGDKNNEQKIDDGQYPFFVRSQQIERINSYSFDGEAILVPGEGNIGQIFHYVNGKFDWHQRVYKISDFSDFICGKYVYHQMKHSFGEYALKNTVKATVDSLRLPTFKNFEFWVPTTVKEQTAIASILSDMDSEIEELEQKLNKTRKLKQGMMQQLLTGKIRLVEKDTVIKLVRKQNNSDKAQTGHNHQFDDAVMIAAIVNAFYSEKYPLGRKKVQKLLYLLRRKQEVDTSAFKKKAAGPYADDVRYKGGEPIAKSNGYISVSTSKKGTSFSKGKNIGDALSYVEKWNKQSDIDWLFLTFKYVGVNDLELYATVDMAICDLKHQGVEVTVDSVKNLIRSNDVWKAKLKKSYFSDVDIARAIDMSKQLFSN